MTSPEAPNSARSRISEELIARIVDTLKGGGEFYLAIRDRGGAIAEMWSLADDKRKIDFLRHLIARETASAEW